MIRYEYYKNGRRVDWSEYTIANIDNDSMNIIREKANNYYKGHPTEFEAVFNRCNGKDLAQNLLIHYTFITDEGKKISAYYFSEEYRRKQYENKRQREILIALIIYLLIIIGVIISFQK